MPESPSHVPWRWRHTLVAVCAVSAALAACMSSLDPGTSGSETGNGWITGVIVDSAGHPVPHVQVTLLPDTYNPCVDSVPYRIDTTDPDGVYEFTRIKSGNYTVQSVHLSGRLRALTTGVWNDGNAVCIPNDTLRSTGSIKITPPVRADPLFGYLFIPGTTVFAFLNNSSAPVLLDSVPAGEVEEIWYGSKTTDEVAVVTRAIEVVPQDTVVITNTDWQYSKKLFLNTTAAGARVMGTVTDFPLLVRLNRANFPFAQARGDGADLRFAGMDGEPLRYEIERWDSTGQRAEIWVRLDTVFGNDASRYITMFWGNRETTAFSNGEQVFDTALGFQAVWHLNESPRAGTPGILDRSAHRLNGLPRNALNAADIVEGAVGTALNFDGPIGSGGDWVQIPNNASLEYTGYLAVSAWFRVLDTGCNCDQGIFSKYVETSSAMRGYVLGYHSNKRLIFAAGSGTVLYYIYSDSTIVDNGWHLVMAGVSSDTLFMYLDGKKQTASIRGVPVSSEGGAGIGIVASNVDGMHFVGDIDEVRVERTKRSADWVRLGYMNQRTQDLLVKVE